MTKVVGYVAGLRIVDTTLHADLAFNSPAESEKWIGADCVAAMTISPLQLISVRLTHQSGWSLFGPINSFEDVPIVSVRKLVHMDVTTDVLNELLRSYRRNSENGFLPVVEVESQVAK